MERILGRGVPEDIGEIALGVYVVGMLRGSSKGQKSNTYWKIPLQALVSIGAMVAVLVPLEVWNTERTEKEKKLEAG